MKMLMVDVGGTNVKLMASREGEMRKVPSGPKLSGPEMVEAVLKETADWEYDRISIGFPSLIRDGRPIREPLNLGGGWLDLDYGKALGKPVRFINDASMQALGSYRTGRLLFFGLGTSTGASVIVDDTVLPIEIGLIRLSRKEKFMDRLCKDALKTDGLERWTEAVHEAVELLMDVFAPDEMVLGGGNAKHVNPLPARCRLVDNRSAYIGAERLWEEADLFAQPRASTWQIIRRPPSPPPVPAGVPAPEIV